MEWKSFGCLRTLKSDRPFYNYRKFSFIREVHLKIYFPITKALHMSNQISFPAAIQVLLTQHAKIRTDPIFTDSYVTLV